MFNSRQTTLRFPRPYKKTTATTAPPTTHPAFLVITGAAPVLLAVDVVVELTPVCAAMVIVPVAFEHRDARHVDVLSTVGLALVFEGTELLSTPAVIITGIYVKSVPVKVSVVEPGKFACLPPNDSLQTAEDASREQSKYPVNATSVLELCPSTLSESA